MSEVNLQLGAWGSPTGIPFGQNVHTYLSSDILALLDSAPWKRLKKIIYIVTDKTKLLKC